jgi:hypothetical protein
MGASGDRSDDERYPRLPLNACMAIDWVTAQAISVGAGLIAASVPAALRTVRRLQIRTRLRQNLDLASAVREHGPSVELDPVLSELIAQNLAELAQLEGRRLRAAPSSLAWKAVQLVSVVGWAFAAVLAVMSTGGLPHNAVGLVIFALAVDLPLLLLAIVGLDMVRRRSRRVGPRRIENGSAQGAGPGPVPREVTLAEQTRDLAEELAPTLPLGRRDQRSDLGPQWRTGRAAVPPSF